jgi:hypothetical protein
MFMSLNFKIVRRLLIGILAAASAVIIAVSMTESEEYGASHPYLHEAPCPFCRSGGPIVPTRFQKLTRELNPFYRHSSAAKCPCIAGLKQLDGAIAQWALEEKKADTARVTLSDLAPYFRQNPVPQCPHQGVYRVTTVSERPTCTFNGKTCPHHSLEPEKFR